MNSDIYIGIDMGSSGLKVVAFQETTGTTLAAAGETLPFLRLPAGACELEAAAIEGALTRALRSVASQLGTAVSGVLRTRANSSANLVSIRSGVGVRNSGT